MKIIKLIHPQHQQTTVYTDQGISGRPRHVPKSGLVEPPNPRMQYGKGVKHSHKLGKDIPLKISQITVDLQ